MRSAELLAASVLLRVSALSDSLVATIQERNPGYRAANVVPVDDLWESCHENLTSVLQLISDLPGDDVPPDDDPRYDAARATGQRRAVQRLPLDDVLRSFRLGGRLVWEALIDQARQDRSVAVEDLVGVATRVWEVVDTTSAQVASAYHAAERHLVRVDEQRRATLWEGLLRGRAKDLAFAHEAARIVGVPVEGPYVVVTIDIRAQDDVTAEAVRQRLAADGIDSAWQVRADTLVGLLVMSQPDTALIALREILRGPAGVSLVVPGLADIDTGYHQAVLARRTLAPGRAEVAALQERLPEALLLSSPELAEQLVSRWLGPLLKPSSGEHRLLLDTLDTWVETRGSVTGTAQIMHCHRNTVLNRLNRIHMITGHDVSDADSHTELALALRASHLLTPRAAT